MKKVIMLIYVVAISISSIAQIGGPNDDDDKDGVINKEDACPNTFGTKANKGCPEKNAVNNDFISNEVFTKLLTAVCNQNLNSIASTQKDGELTISNLSLVGKNKNLPIAFKVHPDKTAEVYTMLSESITDIPQIANEILSKLKNSTINNKQFANAFLNSIKDTIAIIIPPIIGNKYYEMGVYAHQLDKNKWTAIFAILDYNRTITKEQVDDYYKLKNPPVTTKTKEPIITKSENKGEITLDKLVILANAAVKKNKNNPFKDFKTNNLGRIIAMDPDSNKECKYNIENAEAVAVNNDGDEIIIQMPSYSDEELALAANNPCTNLATKLKNKLKIISAYNNGNYMANYENIQITSQLIEGDLEYAVIIFIRKRGK